MRMGEIREFGTWVYATRVGMLVPLEEANESYVFCWMLDTDKVRKVHKQTHAKTVKPAPTIPEDITGRCVYRKLGATLAKKRTKKRRKKAVPVHQGWPMTVKHTGEACANYNEYLRSAWWRYRRLKFGTKYEQRCGLCRRECEKPNLHHLSYRRIGNERDGDLVWLCEACHHGIHKSSDRPKLTRFPK